MNFALWRDRLTLLVVALLPWQARYIKESAALLGAPWEQGTVAVFALEMLLLAALACHLLTAVSRCEPKKAGAPLWLQLSALIPLYAFISIFWAYDTIGALESAIHLFEGYALAYLIWVSGVSLASMLAAFIGGAAVSSALGIWQFFTQTTFASSWLGLAAHPAAEAGVAVVETASGRFLRAYGTLPHPNVLGGYAAAGLVAVLALFGEAKRYRILLIVAGGMIASALVLTFSRSAWIAVLLAASAGLLLSRHATDKEARMRRRPMIAMLIACAAIAAAFSAPLLSTRLSGQGRLETRSISDRVTAATSGLELFRRHAATGVGIGNYLPTAFVTFGPPSDPYAVTPPHFVPLLLGVELGFFGLAVLLGFVVAWWFDALWLLRRSRSATAAVAAALPIVVIIVSCFDHYPYDLFAGIMLTGAVFGLFLKAGETNGG